MYHSNHPLAPHRADVLEGARSGPLDRLYGREREIAAFVYGRGLSTAVDVEEHLSTKISNATVRTTLNRLVRKGVLTRMRCGSERAFFYGPAFNQFSARELELKQFANDFFDGSLEQLANAIADMFASERTTD